MKSRKTFFTTLVLALTLAAHLSFLAPTASAAQNTNSSTTTTTTTTTTTRRVAGATARCRARCLREYNLCRRGIAPPHIARCRARYRACLRRCR